LSASTGKADHCARSKRRYGPQGEASGGEPKVKINFPDIPNGPWFPLRPLRLNVAGGGQPARPPGIGRDLCAAPALLGGHAAPSAYHSDRGHHAGLDDAAGQRVMAEEDAVLYRFAIAIAKTHGNL
jgi:hypothetical protein